MVFCFTVHSGHPSSHQDAHHIIMIDQEGRETNTGSTQVANLYPFDMRHGDTSDMSPGAKAESG